jgi:uncharacterized protein
MDLISPVPAGPQVIERYGSNGFRISGVIWHGSVLVSPDFTQPWAAADAPAVTAQSLMPIVEHGGIEVLLLGLGRRMSPLMPELRLALRQIGVALEAMDTGAACRTFNALVAEDRRVGAALIPPT